MVMFHGSRMVVMGVVDGRGQYQYKDTGEPYTGDPAALTGKPVITVQERRWYSVRAESIADLASGDVVVRAMTIPCDDWMITLGSGRGRDEKVTCRVLATSVEDAIGTVLAIAMDIEMRMARPGPGPSPRYPDGVSRPLEPPDPGWTPSHREIQRDAHLTAAGTQPPGPDPVEPCGAYFTATGELKG